MGHRNRKRKIPRREPFRKPKPIILIVCEGKVTEPGYLRGFQRECKNPRVEIRIADDSGVPRTLFEVAKEYKKEAEHRAKKEHDDNLKYDAVWCVFDVDEHPNIPDAKEMARANGVQLAISNPCFELWLLLHFRDSPGMQHRDRVCKLLREFLPGFAKYVDYNNLRDGYEAAVRRARALQKIAARTGEPTLNPTTNVFQLTESIRIGK